MGRLANCPDWLDGYIEYFCFPPQLFLVLSGIWLSEVTCCIWAKCIYYGGFCVKWLRRKISQLPVIEPTHLTNCSLSIFLLLCQPCLLHFSENNLFAVTSKPPAFELVQRGTIVQSVSWKEIDFIIWIITYNLKNYQHVVTSAHYIKDNTYVMCILYVYNSYGTTFN